MARERKLEKPIVLFASIEARQHESLRRLAFADRRSIADIVREAIDQYLKGRKVISRVQSRRTERVHASGRTFPA